MKINPISFGKTYLHQDVTYLTPQEQKKLIAPATIGEAYPNDIFINVDSRKNVNAEIERGSYLEYLKYYGELDFLSDEQIEMLQLSEFLQNLEPDLCNHKSPRFIKNIGNLKTDSDEEISCKLLDAIEEYNQEYSKDRCN